MRIVAAWDSIGAPVFRQRFWRFCCIVCCSPAWSLKSTATATCLPTAISVTRKDFQPNNPKTIDQLLSKMTQIGYHQPIQNSMKEGDCSSFRHQKRQKKKKKLSFKHKLDNRQHACFCNSNLPVFFYSLFYFLRTCLNLNK